MTFAEDIEQTAGESIEAIVIGPFGWDGYAEDRIERATAAQRGVVLSWEEARPMLDYHYSTGFGAPECDAIRAWTASKILWVTQYDGATYIDSAPRNPLPEMPTMPGG
jgi:hypothetical protein